jgi:23S rRNA pseudouridine1911/1915/1917 synthase
MDGFQVLYEDNHLIAVSKAPGVLVQGDNTGDTPLSELVKDYLKYKYEKPGNVFCGVVHRLDRPVSGLVLLAKTSKALERMNKIFHDRKVEKVYWAVVTNRPEAEEGSLAHWIVKDETKNIVRCLSKEKDGAKQALLDYRLLGKVGKDYLLEVKPHTGRSHQIRAQLAKMGCPIKGDLKYGSTTKMDDGSIMLHSRRLSFEHPVQKTPCRLEATVPDHDDWRKFKHLG